MTAFVKKTQPGCFLKFILIFLQARDLLAGYVLCIVTYAFIGFVFYAAFPLAKSCIADNLLNNFGTGWEINF